MSAEQFFQEHGWEVRGRIALPARPANFKSFGNLDLSAASRKYLTERFESIYAHQYDGIARAIQAENVCLATSTASGKSLVFHVAAIEHTQAKSEARVLAIFPLKALATEQRDRWQSAFTAAGSPVKVGRIDGSVPVTRRKQVLAESQVVTMTPDIIHAWLLSSLSDPTVIAFLRNLRLIVVDEVHSYSGVFGSNAALMFRRLRHALSLLKARHRFVLASATIADPQAHIRDLIGVDCQVVGSDLDGSPKYGVEVVLVDPEPGPDLLTQVSRLLAHLATVPGERFIAFVDSRKQTEQLASILGRPSEDEVESADAQEPDIDLRELESLAVLPYRSGYEEHDRIKIQNALAAGTLRGVVSTSALELGLDIQGLEAAVLVGVPRSSTSLIQRIGRIGRHGPGRVYVLNTGSLYDREMFTNPEDVLNRPMERNSLYLENQRVQYIHALCLARLGGEHDQLTGRLNLPSSNEFNSPVAWPDGFLALCNSERTGTIPGDLQSMKAESGDDPNHTFPLRDVESQFKVEWKQGPEVRRLGSLSYSQLLREAYPGAVYYYITKPYRVTQVLNIQKIVKVRREKRYTTRPTPLPTLLFPDLQEHSVYQWANCAEGLTIAECNLQVRESILGYQERRGSSQLQVQYPADPTSGVFFNLPRFSRAFFTSGVVLTWPELNEPGVQGDVVAYFLHEAFLMTVPIDRQDVNHGADRLRGDQRGLPEGTQFVSLFDQTYGSLRLSGMLTDAAVLQAVTGQAADLAARWSQVEIQRLQVDVSEGTMVTLRRLKALVSVGVEFLRGGVRQSSGSGESPNVILPGSMGINTLHQDDEFEVASVFVHLPSGELRYRGRNRSSAKAVVDIVPVAAVRALPGISRVGRYNPETGEVEAD